MHFALLTKKGMQKYWAEISLQIMRTSISVAIYDQALGRYLYVSIFKKNIVKVLFLIAVYFQTVWEIYG